MKIPFFTDHKQCIVWDLEFTTWDGAMKNKWQDPGQLREIVQIGAVKIQADSMEVVDTFEAFVLPSRNPLLSEFFQELTGINQKEVDAKGGYFPDVARSFFSWVEGSPMYAFGGDGFVLAENYGIHKRACPFSHMYDVRIVLEQNGLSCKWFHSGTLHTAIGLESKELEHNALGDAKNIVRVLDFLSKK